MKLQQFLIVFAYLVSPLGFSQTNLPNQDIDRKNELKIHLQDVNDRIHDSTYHLTSIPKAACKATINGQHLPYPILMIHGLSSSSDTWSNMYNTALLQGLSYGGTMDFCLNSDRNLYFSNLSDITDYSGGLAPADFYLINFNVDADGTAYGHGHNTSTESNLAAIVKQGIAVKMAIAHILQATGKNKVVILAHSMGGLATREYIQNPNLWQPDNQHHIAKLVTTGTPHGGSNTSGTWVASFLTPDESSDAVRDLRRSYYYSNDAGVYLYGGIESNSVMDDQLFSSFYNTDVNCNGINGETITGLNQKNLSRNLDFSCIIGDYWGDVLGGDMVVRTTDAQLKNFYTITSETFIIDAKHTDLPAAVYENYKGLDEPDYYSLAYDIEVNTTYTGYISEQAPDGVYIKDYDYFTFSLQQPGTVSVSGSNLPVVNSNVKILSGSSNLTCFINQGFSTSSFNSNSNFLPAGTYTLELSAFPTDSSWKSPYNFIINYTPSITTGISEGQVLSAVQIQPNPATDHIEVSASNPSLSVCEITITDMLGRVIHSENTSLPIIHQSIDISSLTPGSYIVRFKNDTKMTQNKFIKIN